MYLTDAEMAEIEQSGSRIKKGTSYYQAVKKQFGENYYYIGYNTGLTGDAKRMKYWVKCDADGVVIDANTNPSNNNYFGPDGTPRETRAGNNTEVIFPKITSLRTAEGKLIGNYSVKFDFTQPDVGNIYNGYSDTVCFRACGTHPFYMTRNAFRIDSVTNFNVKTGDDSQ